MYSFGPKILIWCLSLLFGFGAVLAQSTNKSELDSLILFLKENPESYLTQYDIAELLKDSDSSAALQYVKNGLANANNVKDHYGVGRGRFLLGNFYSDYDNPQLGEYYYKSADTLLSKLIEKDSSKENLKLWVRNVFNIGVVRSYQGVNEDIYYLNKITPVAEKIGYYEILAKANSNIAISFYNSGQLEKARTYFLIGGQQHIKAEDYKSLITNKLIFSSCLLQMDSLVAAKEQLDVVKPILDSIPIPEKKQLYHTVLAEYHIGKKSYETALVNLKQAEKILKGSPVQMNKIPLYLTFLKVYRETGDYKKGLEYAQICLDLASFYKNKIIEAEIYKELAYFQHKLDKNKRAFESLASYVSISDSLNISELEKEINRLETRYKSEKKEREILELKNENDTVELQLTRKRSQNYFLTSISLGLLVLTSLAFFSYRNFKKRDQLKTAEINKLKYEQESKVYNAMLEGQENERKRLAIDLHDGLAGRLSATRIKLEKLAKKSKSDKSEKDFKQAAKNIDDSLTELRGIAMNLMPETLFKYGLKNAIEDYCSSISTGLDDVKFIIQFYDTERALPNNMSLTIYRIIQELINNAVKHSKASEVLVQYLIDNDKINITVEDNGKGFSSETLKDKGGMGLNNLKTRVAYLSGEMDFDSIPNEGTNVHIVIDI